MLIKMVRRTKGHLSIIRGMEKGHASTQQGKPTKETGKTTKNTEKES